MRSRTRSLLVVSQLLQYSLDEFSWRKSVSESDDIFNESWKSVALVYYNY